MPVENTWAALVEDGEGNMADALDTAQQMLSNAQQMLDKLDKQPQGKELSVSDIQRTKKEKKRLTEKVQYWSDVVTTGQSAIQGNSIYEEADSSESIESDSRQREIGSTASLLDVVRTLYSKGKEVASKLFSMKFFDVTQTPKFMQELGLRGDKFTIKYGVIARHLGKDGSHDLSERDWEQLPQALQNPFAISKLTDKKDSYRIYTTLQTESGEFVIVGADVKNAGREIEVNAVSTVFGRRNNANLPKNEEVIYRSKEITPEQSALLKRPNFAQYPTEQELSEDKDTTSVPENQILYIFVAKNTTSVVTNKITTQ